jgi:hypothetical protein
MPPLPNRGRYHDLEMILTDLRAQYFPHCAGVTIRWGRWSGRTRVRSMRFGAYLPAEKLIRIHPALDQAFVPRSFVEFIVYHELLHHVIPPVRTKGRAKFIRRHFVDVSANFPLMPRRWPGASSPCVAC